MGVTRDLLNAIREFKNSFSSKEDTMTDEEISKDLMAIEAEQKKLREESENVENIHEQTRTGGHGIHLKGRPKVKEREENKTRPPRPVKGKKIEKEEQER